MLPAAVAEDQQERQTDLWSAYAAEGISSTSLSDRDQEIRELRQQVQDLTGVLETLSLTQHSSERENSGTLNIGNLGKTDGGTIRDGLKLLQQAAGGTMRNCGTRGKICTAGPLPLVIPLENGIFQNLPRFLGSPQTI